MNTAYNHSFTRSLKTLTIFTCLPVTASGSSLRAATTVTAAATSVAALRSRFLILKMSKEMGHRFCPILLPGSATQPTPSPLCSLTESVLTGATLAVRFSGSVHHTGLLVIAATAGASAAVSRALTEVGVGQLALSFQQGVRVAVRVPQNCTGQHREWNSDKYSAKHIEQCGNHKEGQISP